MAEELELWLVRHGETEWNRTRRVQGDTDVPLNALGLRQAEALAKRIGHLSFETVYTSDLQRAAVTAKTVFPDAELCRDARLREINLGAFEGKVWQDIPEDEQAQFVVWFTGPYDQPVPGGESSDDLQTRVADWLKGLPKTGRVIAFAHGGTISAVLQLFTGRPAPRARGEPGGWGFRLENTSISKLRISETFTSVEVVNDAAHLETLSENLVEEKGNHVSSAPGSKKNDE